MFNPQHGFELPSSELPVGKSFATIALIVNVVVLGLRLFESATAARRAWSLAPTRSASHFVTIAVRHTYADPRSLMLLSLCTLATVQAGIDVTFAYKSTTKSRWVSHYPGYSYTAVSAYTCCFTLISWCALWRIRALAHISHNQGEASLATALIKQPWSFLWWYRFLGKAAMFLGPIATILAILITLRSLDVQAARPTATLEWKSWTIPPWALIFYSTFPIVPVALTIASYLSAFGALCAPALLARFRASLQILATSPSTTVAPVATSPSSSPCASPIPMDHPLLPHTRQDGGASLHANAAIESMRWTYRLLTLLYIIGWVSCSLLVGSIMFMFSFVTWVPVLGLVLAFLVLIESQFCKCEDDTVGSGIRRVDLALVYSVSPMSPGRATVLGGNRNGERLDNKEIGEKPAVTAERVLRSRDMEMAQSGR
ncbi:hypothetical protein BCR44DRAFT_36182 [Catenaria anguillulae PL171]|uniref:Uncharacterized protein n=1 Tax=Catenaria anguillulae PL171 TaxID=765915 RepID=A0A1Y2HKG9_9FUNG|nr:hypothetical protein BCR44DRAFT_36182 [Catenaria anguillulae PL171]